jgi:transposase-like protein
MVEEMLAARGICVTYETVRGLLGSHRPVGIAESLRIAGLRRT